MSPNSNVLATKAARFESGGDRQHKKTEGVIKVHTTIRTPFIRAKALQPLIAAAVISLGFAGAATAASGDAPAGANNLQSIELYSGMTPAPDAKSVDTSHFKKAAHYVVGYAGFGQVNSWRVQALQSTRMLAENMGVDLRITDAGGNATKQISDAEDLLAQGVNALIISPVASEPLAPVVERAYGLGIPVIVWGSDVATDKYTAKVVADDYFFGLAGGRKLAQDMGGAGNVIMLRGIAGNSVEKARYDGAAAALKEAGGKIKIVGEEYGSWAFDQGKSITQTFLAANPKIDGVWASGAAMTRGAIEAFQEAGRPLVPMSGENLNGYMKVWAKLDLRSSGPQFPTWQGPEALKLALRALEGKPIMSSYLLKPAPITDAKAAMQEKVSDDYWVEQYLTADQINRIFPNK